MTCHRIKGDLMHLGRLSAALLVVALGLLVGCSGGGQSGGGSQEGGGGEKQQGAAANGDAPETKIALGKIGRLSPKNERRIVLRTSGQVQEDGGRMVFRIKKNARITLDNKKAELADIKEGQQAQIEYVAENEVNRVVSMTLFEAEGGGSSEGGGSNAEETG